MFLVFMNRKAACFFWSKTPGFRFPESRFYATSVGLEAAQGYVAAWGDFNADKYIDLFVLADQRRELQVWLWDPHLLKFNQSQTATIRLDDKTHPNSYIENVVPIDIDYDGMLDLIVMVHQENDTTLLKLYFNKNLKEFEKAIDVEELAIGQPLLLDWDGDQRVDLFGLGSTTQKPTLWLNTGRREQLFVARSLKELAPEMAEKLCPLSRFQSHAFVDIDGDCLADLVVTCGDPRDHVQLWVNRKKEGFKLLHELRLMAGGGLINFLDINGDGSIDMMYPVCDPEPTCEHVHGWHVISSIQKPWCDSVIAENCRPIRHLCIADPHIQFEERTILMKEVMSQTELGDYRIMNSYNPSPSIKEVHPLLLPIRVGDFNLDGHPDLLVSMRHLKKGTTSVWLFQGDKKGHRFTLKHYPDWENTVNPHGFSAGFFDMHEDGTLDILLMSYTNEKRDQVAIQVYHNNLFNDAYFIKILTLNGVCPVYCDSSTTELNSFKPLGASMVGATIKYTMTDWNARKRVVQGGQLSQTSYMSLGLPYLFFGLGRTNNYIEELYSAIPIHEVQHDHKWICIIPNSQLVVIPHRLEKPLIHQ
jgi:integrin alpha FG-GAP repeat containing protein 1